MGKSNDSITRRKNKKSRKKQEVKDPSKVSYRIASIIAAKKRRLTGKRRMCQGMCFSIPTAEDPFNDRYGKTDAVKNKKRPLDSRVDKTHMDKKRALSRNMAANKDHANEDVKKEKLFKLEKIENNTIASVTVFKSEGKKDVGKPGKTEVPMLQACGSKTDERGHEIFQDCPSKFLVLCLNTIQNALQHESAFSSEDRPFFVHKWGVEFWKFYSSGRDIVETIGADSDSEQIAWVVSCAADTIARKEKGGLSFSSPFLLFIVPSQEKAAKVRKICKPLKALGIHTVSLHPGASIDHQIRGLKSCEPEFLLSTPKRLLELVSLKEVDISGVSLLVIDGYGTYSDNDCIELIRQSISGCPQAVVFSECSSNWSTPILPNLLQGSVCRISSDDLECVR
ncbi:unnamed protein product [Coffea canephora]|uniref:Uncharacterized protein n=1 Tax=Coffea canephora TaxID=49390 RepID=A0A068TWV7_COFCA|nr:unnamed protein product [Coffea canephora]